MLHIKAEEIIKFLLILSDLIGNKIADLVFSNLFGILFLANVIAFSNLENTYDYTARTNFNRDSPKINLKIYLLLHFLSTHPETFRICSGLFFD